MEGCLQTWEEDNKNLIERGVIGLPPIEEIKTATKPTSVYLLDKRPSLIVMAQLFPESTAIIVDRWQELGNGVRVVPENFAEALHISFWNYPCSLSPEHLWVAKVISNDFPICHSEKYNNLNIIIVTFKVWFSNHENTVTP